MKALLIATTSQNPEYNADCDYALLRLTRSDFERWRHLSYGAIDLVSPLDRYGLDLSVFNYHCTYLSQDAVEGLFPDLDLFDAETGGSMVVESTEESETYARNELAQRTECDRIHITPDGVWFSAVPKHCDFTIETPEISWQQLEEVSNESESED